MKKSLRFVAALGISCLAWVSSNARIEATTYPYCSTINGTSCSPAGSHAPCWDQYTQEPTGCICKAATMTWKCMVP